MSPAGNSASWPTKMECRTEGSEMSSDDMEGNITDLFLMKCKPKQCIFRLGGESKLYKDGVREYGTGNQDDE